MGGLKLMSSQIALIIISIIITKGTGNLKEIIKCQYGKQ